MTSDAPPPAAPALLIAQATSPGDLAEMRHLFVRYARSLPIDLAYQKFETELAGLPGAYAPPHGALLLARGPDGEVLGCVALRPFDGKGTGEVKRLYVQDAARGLGAGRALVGAIIGAARGAGYRALVLDTLPSMAAAIRLYEAAGFRPIPAYYPTPVAETLFFRLDLAPA